MGGGMGMMGMGGGMMCGGGMMGGAHAGMDNMAMPQGLGSAAVLPPPAHMAAGGCQGSGGRPAVLPPPMFMQTGGCGGCGGCGMGGCDPAAGMVGSDEVGSFIAMNNLDQQATQTLLSAEPAVQRYVMDRGGLTGVRNPSSALTGRIRDALQSGIGGAGGCANGGFGAAGMMGAGAGCGVAGDIAQQIEVFIMEWGIDERAAGAIRQADPNSQQAILAKGPLTDARNPSAAVLGRLRDAVGGR